MGKSSKVLALLFMVLLYSCGSDTLEVDYLIKEGTIIDGTGEASFVGDIGLLGQKIVFIGNSDTANIETKNTINVKGKVVSPGFIDPHTHSYGDLKNEEHSSNINYLTQGVTTVITGNDGSSPANIDEAFTLLDQLGIGTNVAFLIGHGTVRRSVLGDENVQPSEKQLAKMKGLVDEAMIAGAYGLSSGLYYAPGSYAETGEVIELAKSAAAHGGIYGTHIRDESTYNIGLLSAVEEAIQIAREASIPLNLSHIKALGVDVWGQSEEVIRLVEDAQKDGVKITADQYPWRASGTHLENALINRWVMAGGEVEFSRRLDNSSLLPRIRAEIKENMRKRGGPSSILITADCRDTTMIGFTIEQLAARYEKDPVEVALMICRNGGARIASFNMHEDDIKSFMQQPWVMTSSDGTKGHPRKYASFPTKFHKYVMEEKAITLESFVRSSSDLVATSFGIQHRGRLAEGYFADVLVFDLAQYRPKADFSNPEVLSSGVNFLFVNGDLVIENEIYNGTLAGQLLKKGT